MPKSYWLSPDDNGKDAQLTNLSAKLPNYKTTFGLDDADLASVRADSAFFHFCLTAQGQVAAFAQQWTAYKNAARSGGDAALGPVPVAPTLGAAPATVAPGIFKRLTALVAHLKTHKNYTEAIGADLQITGTDQTVDLTALKPVLTVALDAGQVVVGWTKQGLTGVEIWVDRGDGKGFLFLAVDTIPDYTDTQPLPAGQTALWKYKAIYHQGDDRVGQWSDVVSLPVAG